MLFKPDEADKYHLLTNPEIVDYGRVSCENAAFGVDIKMPYYIDLGFDLGNENYKFFPFTGAGLTKSAFSSLVAAKIGIKYFGEDLRLNLKYIQTVIPDFACFDYEFCESYILAEMDFNFKGNIFSTEITAGQHLNAIDYVNFFDLKDRAFTAFGITEKLCIDLLILDDSLNKISAKIYGKLKQIPDKEHFSWEVSASAPVSFDLVYLEFGLLPRLFHAGLLSIREDTNIGKRHFIYENAVMLGDKNPASKYYRFYETSAALDCVLRFFAFPLDAPADRLYLALNLSGGIGYDNITAETDFLYAWSLSAGFDLNDNTPFEIRFGMDQDGYLFTYMTVVNRISHPF